MRADDIGVDEGIRAVDRTIDMALRGEVHDRVDRAFVQQPAREIEVTDVALHQFDVRHPLETRGIAGIGQRIEHCDVVVRMVACASSARN